MEIVFSGIPSPTITWTKQDGMPLHNVAGLRQIRIDGSSVQLVYLPFGPNDYRQDIHSTTVRCIASNPVGVIESRECHVRASEFSQYNTFLIYFSPEIKNIKNKSFLIRENVFPKCAFESVVEQSICKLMTSEAREKWETKNNIIFIRENYCTKTPV